MPVIDALSFERQIATNLANALKYTSTTDMVNNASGREFGVSMILMSVGMLSSFLILLPLSLPSSWQSTPKVKDFWGAYQWKKTQ